jgi:hypothetical protein
MLARHVCERAGVTHFVEKTPTNVYAFAALTRSAPDVRLVQLVRDGRDVAASLGRRGKSLYASGSRWLYDTLAGIRARGHASYLEIRYEDLVRDPAATLARVFAHIGLAQADGAPGEGPGTYREDWRQKRSGAGWNLTPDDAVSDASVGRFRRELSAEQLGLLERIRLTDRARRELDAPVARFDELIAALGYPEAGMAAARGVKSQALAWLAAAGDGAARAARALRYTRRPAFPLTTLGRVRAAPSA